MRRILYRPLRSALFAFFALALPVQIAYAQRPEDFQNAWRLGKPVTVSGELTVIYADDVENHHSRLIHLLRDDRSGQTFQVRFETNPKATLRSGSRVKVVGRSIGSEIFVAATQADLTTTLTANASAGLSSQTTALPGSEQRTLVMLANFQDVGVSCSAEAVRNVMFSDPAGKSVNALYTGSSVGKVSVTGDVIGPFTLAASSADPCNYGAWGLDADTQAAALGVDLTSYAHKVYVMPSSSCSAAGMATVGGAPSRAWIYECNIQGVYAHEFGHNLGMDHASTATEEYGDNTDPMSIASWMLHGVNAPHRHQLNWLTEASAQLISHDGTYAVAPLAQDPSEAAAPQVFMVRKPDTAEYYYISYRTSLGVDSYIDSSYYNRLSIHRYKGDGSSSRTYLLAGRSDGESFVDDVNGISVSLLSHSATQAAVDVRFVPVACVSASPVLSFTPQALTGGAGLAASYAVTLTNKDGSACPASSFALNSSVPSGWTASILPATLTLTPGVTGQAILTVIPAAGAAPATYTVQASASDSLQGAHGTSAAASYTVQSVNDSVCPTSPANLTAMSNPKRKQTQLTWNSSIDNVGVSGYRVMKNGVVVATLGNTMWTDKAWTAGTTTYAVVAFDAAGNVSSPSNAVSVVISGRSR
jgi:hypothetical protein